MSSYTPINEFVNTRDTIIDWSEKSQFCFMFFEKGMDRGEEFCQAIQKGVDYNYFKLENIHSLADLDRLEHKVCYIDCTNINSTNVKNLANISVLDRSYFKPELGAVTYLFMYNEADVMEYATYNWKWHHRALSTYLATDECLAYIERDALEASLKSSKESTNTIKV